MKNIISSKYLLVIVSLLSSNPRVWADTLEFANGQTMQTDQISSQENANNFQYSLIKVNYTSSAVTDLKLNDKESKKIIPDGLFVSDAHASVTPIDQNVFTAGQHSHRALRSAIRFQDVQPFVSKEAYQTLIKKLDEGSKEILVLQLLKTSIPDQIEVIQTQVKDNFAWVIARGKMRGQTFWGTLAMTREEGQWKLIQETWFGNQSKPVVIKNMRNAEDFLNQINDRPDNEFITWVDAAGRPKSNLPLEYGKIRTPKNSFCFFFFLNPQEHKKQNRDEVTPKLTAIPSPDLHLVWPTSGVRHNPKVYEKNNDEGFDVSVAADRDGYYPNKMNLRLPGGKPKEVYVGFLLSF